eukprot:3628973-Pyramimonas_sp.AAC.1
MHAAKLYTPWKEEMEQRCEFLDRGITNKLVAKVCNTLFLRIMDFNDAAEQRVLELALMEALMMVAPMEGADG